MVPAETRLFDARILHLGGSIFRTQDLYPRIRARLCIHARIDQRYGANSLRRRNCRVGPGNDHFEPGFCCDPYRLGRLSRASNQSPQAMGQGSLDSLLSLSILFDIGIGIYMERRRASKIHHRRHDSPGRACLADWLYRCSAVFWLESTGTRGFLICR